MQRTRGNLFAIQEKYENGSYQEKFISIFIPCNMKRFK